MTRASNRSLGLVQACLMIAVLGCRARPPQAAGGSRLQDRAVPVLLVETEGAAIVDEPKVAAKLTVARSSRLSTDVCRGIEPLDKPRKIKIELRGRTSQFFFFKPQFGFSFRGDHGSDAPFVGLPPSKKWVLHGPYADKSLMRNALAYRLAGAMDRPSPQTRFVELCVDTAKGRPEYLGVYLLTEHVRAGNHWRPLSAAAPAAPAPAFLIKIDALDQGEQAWVTRYGTQMIHVAGGLEQAREAVARFEDLLAGAEGDDAALHARLGAVADLGSFADYLLLNELARNVDAYDKSVHLHADAGGRLAMGPVWDFDLGFGNASYRDGWRTDGWVMRSYAAHEIPFWWDRLMESPRFRAVVQARWRELRRTVLHADRIFALLDGWALELGQARARNFARWQVQGGYVWPNPHPISTSADDETRQLKAWLQRRCAWMDAAIDGLDTSSPSRTRDDGAAR